MVKNIGKEKIFYVVKGGKKSRKIVFRGIKLRMVEDFLLEKNGVIF